MSIFNFDSYKPYLKSYLSHLPRKGRGEITKIAAEIKMQSTLLSMVISGNRELSLEQAFDLSGYLQHTDLESEYFLALVQYERAGHQRLKAHFEEKIEKLKADANKMSNRFEHEKKLSDQERSVFYSSWIFSAIRLFCSTALNGKSIAEIIERFQLPRQRVVTAVNFMVASGLIIEENDRFQMGISRTFLENDSPHLPRHHMNWRTKALQKSDHVSEEELMFTFPHSVSKEDFQKIKEILAGSLKEISKIVKDSPAEDVSCLNIDLFWIEK